VLKQHQAEPSPAAMLTRTVERSNRLFVSRLSRRTADSKLREAFETCGRVTKAHVAQDKETSRSLGYGTVVFQSVSDAQRAIDQWDGKPFDGSAMICVAFEQGKADFFFPDLLPATRLKLQFDETAMFSVTEQRTADRMTALIRAIALDPITEQRMMLPQNAIKFSSPEFVNSSQPLVPCNIVDATSCVGGNTISFAQSFLNVAGIEFDESRHAALAHNLKLVGLDRVVAIHGSCLDVLPAMNPCPDIAFFDPPWGGLDYKSHDKVKLFLGDANMRDVIASLRSSVRFACVKTPNNFDESDFLEGIVATTAQSVAAWIAANPTTSMPMGLRMDEYVFRFRFEKMMLYIVHFTRGIDDEVMDDDEVDDPAVAKPLPYRPLDHVLGAICDWRSKNRVVAVPSLWIPVARQWFDVDIENSDEADACAERCWQQTVEAVASGGEDADVAAQAVSDVAQSTAISDLTAPVVDNVSSPRSQQVQQAQCGLPAGWSAHWSNKHSGVYYNTPDGESTWERPI
jgi:hypothetical protein